MQQLEEITVSPVQNLAAMHRGLKALDEQISRDERGLDEETKDAIQDAISAIKAYDIESGREGAHQMTITILRKLETRSIKAMREQRAIKAMEYEQELARIAPGLQYGEDKFLMALKKKGESFREGNVKIIRSSRTTRAVLTEKFAAKFPDLLAKVCKVELTKADALVGKKTMDDFVEKKTTYSYEVLDMALVDPVDNRKI